MRRKTPKSNQQDPNDGAIQRRRKRAAPGGQATRRALTHQELGSPMQPTSEKLPVSSVLSRGGNDVGQAAGQRWSLSGDGAVTPEFGSWTRDWAGLLRTTAAHPTWGGAWNIRTLQDVANTSRPERRTALVCKELARFNVDVAALSKTRLPEEGNIREAGTGYTIFWRGKAPEEPRTHGVGFAIRSQLVQQHNLAPKAINERLMTVRIPITRDSQLTLISVYAPTLTSTDEDKAAFYTQLDRTIQAVPANDKLVVLGDFNARVGKDHRLWEGILGRHGIGNCNANGQLLLGLCAEHQLVVTNTIFQLPKRQKTTWRHPRSKHWHILDYVLTKARDRGDVRITRSMLGADDCWTDHRLLISRLSLTTLRPPRRTPDSVPHRRFDCSKLRNPQLAQNFREACERHLADPVGQATVEHHWTTLRDAMTRAAEETLGYTTKKGQDWFDENDATISLLIEAKRQARLTLENQNTAANKRAHKVAVADCQRGIREAQNIWWQRKAAEIQSFADQRDLRSFYAATKEIFGPTRSSVGGLKDVDGATTITDSADILDRWRSHFENLLNDHADTPDDLLRMTPQHPVRLWMALTPSIQDFNKALKRMKPGKAPGPDNIPLELLTHGGPRVEEQIDAPYTQNMGDQDPPHIASKIFARILLDRLLILAEDVLPESQCGFRPSRRTIDMIFCARQLQEKSLEQRQPIMFVFWDLKKAFDKVPRPAMWAVLARYGCPPDFVKLVRALHDGMVGRVCHQNSLSGPFPINGGLKQGCVLAPTCFSLYTAAMLNEIPPDTPSIDLRFRLDGGVFNLARLRARTKTTLCQSADDLQLLADAYNSAYERFGMQVNTDKTKTLVQHPPGLMLPNFNTTVNNQPLEEVDQFSYLGSILSSVPTCKKDVENRIRAAHSAFGRLNCRVFNNHALTMATKIMVFRAVVLSTLLYACETWTLYRNDIKNLERFQQTKLRQILKIPWECHTTNIEVLERASVTSVEATIIRHRLRWVGHVHRMDDSRLPKKLLYGELAQGTRARGAPKIRYKDQLKHPGMAVPPPHAAASRDDRHTTFATHQAAQVHQTRPISDSP
ncbi:uncharacterized protein LOC123498409 [Portunus trituberculatus]|uniref:uncharacterized protein LOC123498409 n=1 Tax=Portunus trituberculatus TaxID=210409 RepID=UPI001E1CE094|nr:uncharacterized protein LOC123498409 [Portunus trituberculatus]